MRKHISKHPDQYEYKGWRYAIQREHVRGEQPYYSLIVSAPGMSAYATGAKAAELIRPIVDRDRGRASTVRTVILRHIAYLTMQAATEHAAR